MEKMNKEQYKVKGEEIVAKVKQIIKEGNARKITIINPDGKEIASFTLTMGVVGAAIAPVLAAVGALAAVLTSCTIVVEKDGQKKNKTTVLTNE